MPSGALTSLRKNWSPSGSIQSDRRLYSTWAFAPTLMTGCLSCRGPSFWLHGWIVTFTFAVAPARPSEAS